jgi:protein involved in polysaccharide export with SLBB domain
MSVNRITIPIRICGLVTALLFFSACDGDPTPVVEDMPAGSLNLHSTGGRGLDSVSGGSSTADDYRLGPNDRTRITVFGQPNLTGEYTLDGNGVVAFPLIGNVNANGKSPSQLQQMITEKLDPDYLRNPSVSVEVLTRRPFYVLGEVQKPGNYPYVTDITALNAVAMAGGFTYRAKSTQFYIKRLDKNGKMVRILAKPETIVRPGDTVEIRERYF